MISFEAITGVVDDYTKFMSELSFRIGDLELNDMELLALLGAMQIVYARFIYSVAEVEQEDSLPPDGAPEYSFRGE